MTEINETTTVLVTGAAGFIGSFLSKSLLEKNIKVIGIDNLNDYYDVDLKKQRLRMLEKYKGFIFIKIDIEDKKEVLDVFEKHTPNIVINLAAQAGVRYSIENPDVYIKSNIIGFYNILECARHNKVDHLIYASSSSVYGNNKDVPFEETQPVDNPVSLYAATKKSNELMASTYSHLYNIPITGLRFFTVYGPMGRPDMAYFKFAEMYYKGEEIKIYNNGDFENDLYRDFTYIDDIVNGIIKLIPIAPKLNENKNSHEVYNIGNNKPVKLMKFIQTLEKTLSHASKEKVEFKKQYEPIKPGDVPATYASTAKLESVTGYKPSTSIDEGLQEFANWFIDYKKNK